MDILKLRQCKKSPSQGGMSRADVNELAKQYGLDPTKYPRKNDLCDAIMEAAQAKVAPPADQPRTPERTGRTGTTRNLEIARALRELGNRFDLQGEVYRAGAMKRAADIVARFPHDITDPATQLRNVAGIGSGVMDRIKEFISTGTLSELQGEATLTEKGAAIQELMTVYGIGAANAERFYSAGIHSIAELVGAYNQGKINLTTNQEIGLRYYDDFQQRIPREEVTTVGSYILDLNKSLDPENKGDIVGSYRRGLPTSGDIDVIITNPKGKNYLGEIVSRLQEQNFLEHVLALGDVSLHGTYWSSYPDKNGLLRKIDIRYIPPESYATALLHSTGSDQHNVKLRRIALNADPKLSLSEFGLHVVSTGQRIPTETEEDVFKALGVPYVPPEERN